jgi:hypothetical protein
MWKQGQIEDWQNSSVSVKKSETINLKFNLSRVSLPEVGEFGIEKFSNFS